jgi:hypothetical protein
MKYALFAGVLLGLAACAKMPEDIPAARLETSLDHLSCGEARRQLSDERANLAGLSKEQTKIANADKVSSLLVFVPISALSGQDMEASVAAAKGRLAALEARVQRCA